jgi:hypothetical protein
MLQDAWNNPAGGLRYHIRAWRNGHAWQQYRKGLSAWLSDWHPGRSTLLLVGPSAGHCLPFEALTRFERLVVFEIDPVARYLLGRRIRRALPRTRVTWVRDDQWIGPVRLDRQIPEGLVEPGAAILFCNFIGQVTYMLGAGEYNEFQKAWTNSLFPQLEHTPWASFHDRVSGETAPYEALSGHRQSRLDNTEISALYESDPSRELIELNDHCSQELLPMGYDYRYLHWPLTTTRHHLIECVLGGPCERMPQRD